MSRYNVRIGPAVPLWGVFARIFAALTLIMAGPTLNHYALNGSWVVDVMFALLGLGLTVAAFDSVDRKKTCVTEDPSEAIAFIKKTSQKSAT